MWAGHGQSDAGRERRRHQRRRPTFRCRRRSRHHLATDRREPWISGLCPHSHRRADAHGRIPCEHSHLRYGGTRNRRPRDGPGTASPKPAATAPRHPARRPNSTIDTGARLAMILITAATCRVTSAITHELARRGIAYIATFRNRPSDPQTGNIWHLGDIDDPETFKDLLPRVVEVQERLANLPRATLADRPSGRFRQSTIRAGCRDAA